MLHRGLITPTAIACVRVKTTKEAEVHAILFFGFVTLLSQSGEPAVTVY